jgi:hypothetical protein
MNASDDTRSGKKGPFRVRYDRGEQPLYYTCPICKQGYKSHTTMKICTKNCKKEQGV